MEQRRAGTDITLVVLAGGEGSRMGMAKGQLRLGTTLILAALLDRWKWDGPTLLVTAPGREHPAGFERFDREVSDPVTGAGPLRGLLTALENLQTRYAVCTAVDMPALEREQLDWIVSALLNSPALLGVMGEKTDEEQTIEPFPSAYRKEAIEPVRGWLNAGRRSMHSLLLLANFRAVAVPPWDPAVWTNLNLPEEFRRYCQSTGATRIVSEGNDP